MGHADETSRAGESVRTRRRPGVASLVIVNIMLVAGLAWVEFGPVAVAQDTARPFDSRPRGEYTLIGGEIQMGNSDAVYVIDSVNQEMVVLRWDDGRRVLDGIGYRDLDADVRGRFQR